MTSASAERWRRGGHRPRPDLPNFGLCAILAALARSGEGEPNSTARGLDKSINPACMTAPSSDFVCDEKGVAESQWGSH